LKGNLIVAPHGAPHVVGGDKGSFFFWVHYDRDVSKGSMSFGKNINVERQS
jgi:hypothetical protein